jgi:hypothetical protein
METVATTITAQTAAAGSTAEGATVVGEEAETGAVVEAETDPKLLPVEHSTYGRA